mgnify:CR=1 FL=1
MKPKIRRKAMSEVETQAKLKWEVACERLRFAMNNPDGRGKRWNLPRHFCWPG